MVRDLEKLKRTSFDVLVIGGGIYGACVARDAALRGLRTALIERNDFGSGTSANSLKIIHGGLRYLPDANPGLVRRMVAERSNWLRTAPHLVEPLQCLVPAHNGLKNHPLVLSLALRINDLAGFDRNRSLDPMRMLPPSRMLSREECLAELGDFAFPGVKGGAVWHDARVLDTDRLLIALLHSASDSGAVLANHVSAEGWLVSGRRVSGVQAQDRLTGTNLEIRADVVVNCTGAWTDQVDRFGTAPNPSDRFGLSLAMNLVVKDLAGSRAVGLPTKFEGERAQTLFLVPWGKYSVVGTHHIPWSGSADISQVPGEVIDEFLEKIRSAFQSRLSREQVLQVQWGFLPASNRNGEVHLVRESRLHDHALEDGREGLISVVGVKYTTARWAAEKAVDLVFRKLAKTQSPGRTHLEPVWGGNIDDVARFREDAVRKLNSLASPVANRLIRHYGAEYPRLLSLMLARPALAEKIHGTSPAICAELAFAVESEMAVRLTDIVRRRTGLGLEVRETPEMLDVILDFMAQEFQWDQARIRMERQDYDKEAERYAVN